MPVITETISGDVASAMSLVSLTRADTSATPSGVALPLTFAPGSGGSWSVSFSDPSPAPLGGYAYAFTVTWGDGSIDGPFAGTLGGTGARAAGGYLLQQADLENLAGVGNVAVWSNLTNGVKAADANRIQVAILYGEGQVNDTFRGSRFTVPLIGTADGALLGVKDCGARLACHWLYTSRGVRDEATDALLGAWERAAREQLKLYAGGVLRLSAVLAYGYSPDCPFPV